MEKSGSCPFCQSSIDEITICESNNFRTIYNRAPILPGHSMVVPKNHVDSLFCFSDDELAELMVFVKQSVGLLKKAFSCEGFNISLQEKEEAGQTVDHFHLHIIPRKPADLPWPGDWYPKLKESQMQYVDSEKRPKLTRDEMVKTVEFIKSKKV